MCAASRPDGAPASPARSRRSSPAKSRAPALDQRAVGLEMELDAVDGAADAEGLDARSCRSSARCTAPGGSVKVSRCQWKSGAAVAERRRAPDRRGRPRSAAPRASRTRSAGRGCSRPPWPRATSCAPRQMPSTGLVGLAEAARQRREPRQVGMVGVVEGALLAAEDDEAVIAVVVRRAAARRDRRGGGRLAPPASASAVPDLAERRADEILDDEDAHLRFLSGWRLAPHG